MICLGPGFLSIQVYAFIQETAWTRKNLSTLYTLSTRNLPGSGKNWVYCIRSRLGNCLALENWVYYIRPRPGNCPGPGFLSIQVYANNQEYAQILKIWIYYIRSRPEVCLSPGKLSILHTLSTRNLPGTGKFEYPALLRLAFRICIVHILPISRQKPLPGV